MHILSGSDSLLASHLLPVLRDRDQVCAFDAGMGDIRDGTFIDRLIGETRAGIFINCHEMGGTGDCERDRERAYALNALAAGELAVRCRERGMVLVQISTSYVFDGLMSAPYGEDDEPGPVQAYGDSKLLAEKLVRESGCEHLIVRFPDLFGGKGSFVRAILDAVRNDGSVKVLKGHTIAPTYARDAAHALADLVSNGRRGIVHVANAGSVTMRGFITELMGHIRRSGGSPVPFEIIECPYDEYPSPADLPLYNVLDCSRYLASAKSPLRDWQDALAEYAADFRNELSWTAE
jgi:dTDP-4-dehydrorhamnose reductase